MFKYIVRRLMLMVPTLLGITLVCFVVINLVPGSPVEQRLAQLKFGGWASANSAGITQEQIDSLKKLYGFDRPLYVRYAIWLKNIATLNFGESFSSEEPAIDVILEKLPVTLEFGICSALLIYLISVPLGIAKAVHDGSRFDVVTSVTLMMAYSIPPLILGILLRVYLSGGTFVSIFPLGELYSDHYATLSLWGKIGDRAIHFILPLICYVLTGFAALTFLMKNSLLEEIKLDYVRTARAKGLGDRAVIYKHAFRNALIPIITGLGSYLTIYFSGSIIVEQIFNLDGVGLLSYKSILARDYNVIMALIFIQGVLSMSVRLLSDLTYVIVDPRIDFE